MGSPIGEVRSILLTEIPHGEIPFSLVTFPRDTRAFWSLDSKKCFIINGPDDGTVQTWLFVAKEAGTQPGPLKIDPFSSLEKLFYKHGDLYRHNITQAVWTDNQTLTLNGFDNDGIYRITVRVESPNQPFIHKLIRMDPGEGAGNIRLGETEKKIEHLLGAPDWGDAATGIHWNSWDTNTATGREELTVRSEPSDDGTRPATEILVTSQEFTTPDGISTSSSIQDIWSEYPDLQFSGYLNEQRDPAMEIYDDVKEGISFEILSSPRKGTDPVRRCCAIVIHRPGVDVEPMGTFIYPTAGPWGSRIK